MPDKAKSFLDPRSNDGKARLLQLGQLLAFDILVNNTDRMPAGNVWDNEGNSRNLLFGNTGGGNFDASDRFFGQVVAIDQAVVAMDPSNPIAGKRLTLYLQRIETFLLATCGIDNASGLGESESNAKEVVCRALERTRAFVLQETLYDVGVEGMLCIAAGVRHGKKQ